MRAGKSRDSIVIHFQRDGEPEGRCITVSSRQGEPVRCHVVIGTED